MCWASRDITPEDVAQVGARRDLVVHQRTPIRVSHRRSDLVRDKIIHEMQIEVMPGAPRLFLLHLSTSAGTYIKEFVHGDEGRTEPSLGSLLGCETSILQLDVREIDMEWL